MANLKTIRVLIADDHPVFRDGLAQALRDRPELELVGEAGDVREALALAAELRPDVAVIDLRMPRLEGCRVIEALQTRSEEIRVLVLSEHADGGTVHDAVCEGARGYLSKRADRTEICKGITRVAHGERLVDPRVESALLGEMVRRAGAERAPLLTPRELEVLQLSADGHSTRRIGKELHLSPETVKSHLSALFEKLGVTSRSAAVAAGFRRGLLD